MPTFGFVQFTEESWEQIEDYTALCSTEVAAMGYATLDQDVVKVSEIFMVPQVVSGASVEFVETGFPYAVKKAMEEDRLDELRFCWHSHVNFAARFSDTDKDMIRKVRDSGPIPWFASTILNKKGETWAQLDYFQLGDGVNGFCNHLTLELDVQVGEFNEPRDMAARETELEEFLTIKKPPTPKTTRTYTAGKGKKSGEHKTTSGTVGKSGCTPDDWKLHNRAKNNGWEAYIDPEHYVHYWDPKGGGKYKGAAPMPKNDDGTFKLDVNAVNIDSETGELLNDFPGEDGETILFHKDDFDAEDEREERLLQEVMDKGQL